MTPFDFCSHGLICSLSSLTDITRQTLVQADICTLSDQVLEVLNTFHRYQTLLYARRENGGSKEAVTQNGDTFCSRRVHNEFYEAQQTKLADENQCQAMVQREQQKVLQSSSLSVKPVAVYPMESISANYFPLDCAIAPVTRAQPAHISIDECALYSPRSPPTCDGAPEAPFAQTSVIRGSALQPGDVLEETFDELQEGMGARTYKIEWIIE